MPFLKKHYEKIILSIVLLGLVVAAAGLPFMVSRERQQIEEMVSGVVKSRPKPWRITNLSTNQQAVNHMLGPVKLQLSGGHNLFNPVRWIRTPGGSVVKLDSGGKVGPEAVKLLATHPLSLTVSFEPAGKSGDVLRYAIAITRETGGGAASPKRGSAPVLQKSQYFRITKVEGPAEDPTALHVQLDAKALQLDEDFPSIVVAKGKAYKQVVGYIADLEYANDNKTFLGRKEEDNITLSTDRTGQETYKIVVIAADQVVLSSKSTKKTTIRK